MLVSHAWLREWVSTNAGVQALAECLTMGGLEVNSVQPAGPSLPERGVVIGRILRSDPHPASGASRLKVCEVDIGRRTNLTIICGAANIAVGGKVPVATVGAKLPMAEVAARTVGGVESAGMICSAAELGLAEQSDDIMTLDEDAQIGKSVGEYLGLSDSVMELELPANRGDCLGIRGIAREVSALSGAKLKAPPAAPAPVRALARGTARLPVELQAPQGCPRYVGRAVRDIDLSARTPDWMTERLRRSGVRSRNIVVDVTNYVMLELGQPMHAFDLDKLTGGIVVRMARDRERLQLLDGGEITLTPSHLVIADHDKAVALAGIMGGQNSAISATTRQVYLEAAYFPPSAIAGKARALGLHTDASHRFERGVDAGGQADAMQRATRLLVSLAGGVPGPISDVRERKFLPGAAKISLDKSEIRRLLGTVPPGNSVSALLRRLGMQVFPGGTGWKVVVPGWRPDLVGSHDLVEEIARVRGFDKIAPRPPAATAADQPEESRISTARIKQRLVERGYFEAITYSFVDAQMQRILLGDGGIELRNPIADNLAAMRRSLWPGLLEAVRINLNRQHERVRLFEVGHVFLQGRADGGSETEEIHRVAAVASGSVLPRQWGSAARAVDFFDHKGDLTALLDLSASAADIEFHAAEHPALHPGRCAQIRWGKDIVGYLGQLHPSHRQRVDIDQPVYLFELDLRVLQRAPLPSFAAISKYPAVRRDLAVVVAHTVEAQAVLDVARAAAGDLLVELELFDIYAGERIAEDRKSFAFRLTFQSESRNLTASEVDAKTDEIVQQLQRRLDAQLRA